MLHDFILKLYPSTILDRFGDCKLEVVSVSKLKLAVNAEPKVGQYSVAQSLLNRKSRNIASIKPQLGTKIRDKLKILMSI